MGRSCLPGYFEVKNCPMGVQDGLKNDFDNNEPTKQVSAQQKIQLKFSISLKLHELQEKQKLLFKRFAIYP